MLLRTAVALSTFSASAAAASAQTASSTPRYTAGDSARTIAFVNGRWFNGSAFVQRTVYSEKGIISFRVPRRVDTTIDLGNRYVVPPYAEGHGHNVEFYGDARARAIVAKYLTAGVFYDLNPLTLARARDGMKGLVNVPAGVDVIWAVGGLTGKGGHPTGLFLRNLKNGVFTEADGEGGFFFTIDSLADLNRKWPAILAQKPDFIKTLLLYSEEYAKRRDDSTYFNWRGMNPAVLPEVVRRAHAQGLRVMSHIETAADFHTALTAGVDAIVHTPGFRGDEHARLPDDVSRYVITDSDAALAARRGVPVVTTLQGGAGSYPATGPDSALRRRWDDLNRRNLQTLKRHHVRIAIGTDTYREVSVSEAMYLHDLGVFSNLELLKMWSETTPQLIFPKRKIGKLEPGYDASFLILDGSPLTDFANTQRIFLRVKQGRVLSASPSPSS